MTWKKPTRRHANDALSFFCIQINRNAKGGHDNGERGPRGPDGPQDYTNDSAQPMAESVLNSGAIENRARVGSRGGPIRITWEALLERGLAAGALTPGSHVEAE